MVKPRRFNIGDLVLKGVSLATRNPAHRKLRPNWERPYKVINCKRHGSYYLEALDRRKLEHLRMLSIEEGIINKISTLTSIILDEITQDVTLDEPKFMLLLCVLLALYIMFLTP